MQPFFKFFLLLFLSAIASQAQTYDSLWKLRKMERDLSRQLITNENKLAWQLKRAEKDKLHLSWSPLGAIFDVLEPNITLGAEYCLTPTVSVRADMGYIFHSNYFVKSIKAQGFILRPMIRLYSARNARRSFDLAFHYKYVASTQEDWLGQQPVNGIATYSRLTEFDLVRSRWGIMCFFNYQTRPFASNRCYVEFYWGVGVKYKNNVYLKNQPNTTYYRLSKSSDLDLYAIPTIQMGLRLVYKFPHDLFQKNKVKKTDDEKRSEELEENDYKKRNEGGHTQ